MTDSLFSRGLAIQGHLDTFYAPDYCDLFLFLPILAVLDLSTFILLSIG